VIVVDASVLIGYLHAGDSHQEVAETLLAREIDDFAAGSPTLARRQLRPPPRWSVQDFGLVALS
jgi:hypothetical protein